MKTNVIYSASFLVLGIIFILLGALVAVPSRTKLDTIKYSKIEDVDDNTKKVTVNYKGHEKILTVYREMNWAGNKQWRHTVDIEKEIVAIEYNPNNDKDFDTFSGPPQYIGSYVLIGFGVVFILISAAIIMPMLQKENSMKRDSN
jgi:hypothetical protein